MKFFQSLLVIFCLSAIVMVGAVILVHLAHNDSYRECCRSCAREARAMCMDVGEDNINCVRKLTVPCIDLRCD